MTVMGLHTLDEVSQLFTALDFRVSQLATAMKSADTLSDAKLAADWAAFKSQWDSMATKVRLRQGAMVASNLALLASQSLRAAMPDEADYQAVTKAWAVNYPRYTDTDGPGIQIRIEKATGKPVDLTGQPTQATLDLDLKLYQGADAGLKGAAAAGAATQTAASNFVSDNWGKLALLGGAGIGALIVLKKLRLL